MSVLLDIHVKFGSLVEAKGDLNKWFNDMSSCNLQPLLNITINECFSYNI